MGLHNAYVGGLDPYEILGLDRDASEAEIKEAYHRLVREHHPDHNHAQTNDRIYDINWAYEELRSESRHSTGGACNANTDGASADEWPEPFAADDEQEDIETYVRGVLRKHDLRVLADGTLHRSRTVASHSIACGDPNRIREILATPPSPTEDEIVDQIRLSRHRAGLSGGVGLIRSALRQIIRSDARQHRADIFAPLFVSLTVDEQNRAEAAWKKVVSTCFDMPAELGIAVLKQFVHQVKRKALRLQVDRHLVPVIQSSQGGGKSTFVRTLIKCLEDLSSGEVTLRTLTDERAAAIVRQPILFLDDMDGVAPEDVPRLNALITDQTLARRVLGSARITKIRQATTLIGTCNRDLSEVVPDETGNRRYALMPFRSGDVAQGGDAGVWATVRQMDVVLLWRSVDVNAPDPILAVGEDLAAWQRRYRHRDPVEIWLSTLDLDGPAVRAVSHARGTRARGLYELYTAGSATSTRMSEKAFASAMLAAMRWPECPYESRDHDRHGAYYVPRST